MNEGPQWFEPKRYGIGSGLPIAWQGWAVLLAYLAIVGATVLLAGEERPLVVLAVIFPATAVLLLVTARTTKGGWRWRWGKTED